VRAHWITERDSAIKAAIIRLMAEPDKEVQEALLLWQARRMNIVLDGSTHTSGPVRFFSQHQRPVLMAHRLIHMRF
jgi:hypothetical protein